MSEERTMRMMVRFLKMVYTGILRYCYMSDIVQPGVTRARRAIEEWILARLFDPV